MSDGEIAASFVWGKKKQDGGCTFWALQLDDGCTIEVKIPNERR